ncbi:MAG: hypothetical protein WBO88_01585, partial [Candidatus Dechloromonas phosphoritropha]
MTIHAKYLRPLTLPLQDSEAARFCSLPALAEDYPGIRRLPRSLRVVLESVLRNADGQRITAEHVRQLA